MGAEESKIAEPSQLLSRNSISFSINGKLYNVDNSTSPALPLVDFIRDRALLKGTKFMCREGGCGACVVSVKTRNVHTGEELVRSINSCLSPVFGCDGWEITTVEQLGNKKNGYHPFQQRLAKLHGTQCGFCTPGWVMHYYSLLQSKKSLSAKDIEDAADANICRCTGYRPILDAMKSMAIDASEELKRKCGDHQVCWNCPQNIDNNYDNSQVNDSLEDFVRCDDVIPTSVHMTLKSGEQWVKAVDMNTLFLAITEFQAQGLKFKIVGGNTGTGVYKEDGPFQAFVEIKSIHALGKIELSPSRVVLGGAVTISAAIEALNKASMMEGYEYCKIIAKHWQRVANVSVRNAGTLGGNLMIKHTHTEFPSDIFLTLATVMTMLTIASSASLQEMCSLEEFLQMSMMGKIIYSIHFPKLNGFYLKTFKITRRHQNSHAYLNAGFLMKISPDTLMMTEKPNILFGGISSEFIHASMTEDFLVGKMLDKATIAGAMETLEREVNPEMWPAEAQPVYRKCLAQSLLYKVILDILGDKVSGAMKSGGSCIERGLTYGRQTFDAEDRSEWPLYEPVQKLEASFQCSGEAEYVNDIAGACGELQGALVLAKVANATLKKVDTSEAMKLPGVVAWVDYNNIPGVNNYMAIIRPEVDIVFVRDKIHYAGEPVGVILAETRELAVQASKLVTLVYEDMEKPILDIKSALEIAEKCGKLSEYFCDGVQSQVRSTATDARETPHNLKGEFNSGSQHHFHIETHVCICNPREDGFEVYSTTQDITQIQTAIATCLAIPANTINVYVTRLGGGFGGKLARSAHMAAACAIGANAVNRPVRMVMDIETNMSMIGKRCPYLSKYEVGFDDDGKILNLDWQILCDGGCTTNEATTRQAIQGCQNVYAANSWKVQPVKLTTNTPPNTFCRSPGVPHTISCIETIIEHIAFHLKKKPMDVRRVNFIQKGDPILVNPGQVLECDNFIPKLLEDMMSSADLVDREKFIARFNSGNRWKKRGLSVQPTRSGVHYWFSGYYAHVSIYALDGTVAVSHGGIEMGQGMNTKVAQVVARELRIPLDMIKVKRSDNLISPNSTFTGVGVTTEKICFAAVKACQVLQERMAPIKEKIGSGNSWEQLVAACKKSGTVDLSSSYCSTFLDPLKSYDTWGLTASEVEIDCLTGEYKIVRVDMICDPGQSLSPAIDIGQAEGSFVMGLGLWLTEKVQYEPNTGQLLSNRTWNYKPPMAKDIPEDFRITFLSNSPNPDGVLRSKSIVEAPLNTAFSVALAIRAAITSARIDAGNNEWFEIEMPLTPENIHRLCLTDSTQFSV